MTVSSIIVSCSGSAIATSGLSSSGSGIGSDNGSMIGSRGGSGGKENISSVGGRVDDLLLRSNSGGLGFAGKTAALSETDLEKGDILVPFGRKTFGGPSASLEVDATGRMGLDL